jgi:hypothetical protein
MRGAGKLLFVLVCLAAIGICAANPRLRSKIGGCAESVKEEVTPGSTADTLQGQPKVYVMRGGTFYHLKGCPRLEGEIGVPTPLPEARELYQPCPDCHPPL